MLIIGYSQVLLLVQQSGNVSRAGSRLFDRRVAVRDSAGYIRGRLPRGVPPVTQLLFV